MSTVAGNTAVTDFASASDLAYNNMKKDGLMKRVIDHKLTTILISGAATAALSAGIRASVAGLGIFSGMSVTVAGATVFSAPIGAAILAGAGVGAFKFALQRHADKKAGKDVADLYSRESWKQLRKQLLIGTFLGGASGAGVQNFIDHVLPLPIVQTSLGVVKDQLAIVQDKIGAMIPAMPSADAVVEATKNKLASVGSLFGSLKDSAKSLFTTAQAQHIPQVSIPLPGIPAVDTAAMLKEINADIAKDITGAVGTPNVPVLDTAQLKTEIANEIASAIDKAVGTPDIQSVADVSDILPSADDIASAPQTSEIKELVHTAAAPTDAPAAQPQTTAAPQVAAPVVSLSDKLTALQDTKVSASSKALLAKAISGDANALEEVSQKLRAGKGGFTKNVALAYEANNVAADKGSAVAARNRAFYQYHGLGTNAAPDQAIEEMKKLAKHDRMARSYVKEWTGERPKAAAAPTSRPSVGTHQPSTPKASAPVHAVAKAPATTPYREPVGKFIDKLIGYDAQSAPAATQPAAPVARPSAPVTNEPYREPVGKFFSDLFGKGSNTPAQASAPVVAHAPQPVSAPVSTASVEAPSRNFLSGIFGNTAPQAEAPVTTTATSFGKLKCSFKHAGDLLISGVCKGADIANQVKVGQMINVHLRLGR